MEAALGRESRATTGDALKVGEAQLLCERGARVSVRIDAVVPAGGR